MSLDTAGMERRIERDRRKYDRLRVQLRAKADRAAAQVLNAYIVALDANNVVPHDNGEIDRVVAVVGKLRQAHDLVLEVAKMAREPTP